MEFDGVVKKGARGRKAERVQEWLNLHGVGLVVDGDFGPITERQVKKFQTLKNIGQSGQVDQITFEKMTEPMNAVLSPGAQAGESFADCVVRIAKLHLQIHPMEIGGQNRGPWVRMYMNGNQGINWPWCAGFVTFLMKQASELLGDAMPIKGSFSCDSLAAQAKASGRFVKESNAIAAGLPDGSLFLVRRTSTDWTHVGMVLGATSGFFETIEGNTNDEGSHEGYEVCKRVRGYARKDFILL